ncbi:STAS domain-containing protein [Streptomyces xanthochromogenes]|uniref:STAS domain-containing protein n=1 Tax=Streptomyces xanthochromogenes TaxID=67384 RepID=UPI00380AF00F
MTENPKADRPDQLTVESTLVDGVTVVTLTGEIDHGVHGIVSQALAAPDGAIQPRVVADLSGVSFMDSSGINVFINAHQRLSNAEGWLRLAGPQEPVARLLNIVGVDTVIDCHPAVEQALAI